MAIQLTEKRGGRILEAHVTGKLTAEDCQDFTSRLERLIDRHGKIRMLFDMHDFGGWELSTWSSVERVQKHFRDVERIAFAGETNWQEGLPTLCKRYTSAQMRYFDRRDTGMALLWLEEGSSGHAPGYSEFRHGIRFPPPTRLPDAS